MAFVKDLERKSKEQDRLVEKLIRENKDYESKLNELKVNYTGSDARYKNKEFEYPRS